MKAYKGTNELDKECSMTWIYCGTDSPVDGTGTRELLQAYQVIWCPPMHVPDDPSPVPEERLWLVWRAKMAQLRLMLLGGGRIWRAPRKPGGSEILWTDEDHPGLSDAARDAHYPHCNPTTAFLHLRNIVIAPDDTILPPEEFRDIGIYFNAITQVQEEILNQILRIT
jgi:hypothetical protein